MLAAELPLVRCARCRELKAPSEYGKDKSKANGLKSYCRPCTTAYVRGWRWENGEHVPRVNRQQHEGMLWCPRCEKHRAIENFSRSRDRASGFHAYCKGCNRAKRIERVQAKQLAFRFERIRDFGNSTRILRGVLLEALRAWEVSELDFERGVLADLGYLSMSYRYGNGCE